jgi:hypothetical protein
MPASRTFFTPETVTSAALPSRWRFWLVVRGPVARVDLERSPDAAARQPDLQAGEHVEQPMVDREHAVGLDVAQGPAQLQVLLSVIASLGAPVRRFQLLLAADQPDRTALGQELLERVVRRRCLGRGCQRRRDGRAAR